MPSLIHMNMDERLADLRGRGEAIPQVRWPHGARLALSFVLNIEEGAERHILDGDEASEHLNADMRSEPWPGRRNPVMESHYEYGSRVGVWRILELFRQRELGLTAFATGLALERVPAIAARLVADGHEVAAHGWRWIDYRDVPPETEADHIRKTVETIERLTGAAPSGWYTGRISANTRRLVLDHGGFLYDSDAYNDDTPYFVAHPGGRHLVLPYAFDANDMRFASAPGFDTGRDWLDYLVDSFDVLWREGAARPRMMSVGLHCRLAGRPGRLRALERFLDHVAGHAGVWVARRDAIARHWLKEDVS
ncbi:putative urate catabolism protein [Breoghania corrubedonensis]|uniref:Chitooligosaccharide deacetylase n=1 Tax=Breoghania corrubedonensis TaxID=665038 RepID=A0A2T5V6G5_9HYPH|nr:allantoinase PuuE [Breoghania corrubedonensis]PTW59316.1 putative urate catabolism protein [Breoghania corrubedonensis]